MSNQVFPTTSTLRDLLFGMKKAQNDFFENKLPRGNITRHEKFKTIIHALYNEKNKLESETVALLQNEFIALNLESKKK